MVLIMGVVFQMPAVVAFLTWLRILNAGVLKRVWRIALVVIFIAAAVITPTGDPYTQTLVAIPLVVLYFISMGIAALIGRSRRKAEEAEEEEEGDDDGDGGGEGGDDDGEQPALTTGEPDTPTLPRDSSTPAGEQRTGRGYWPDDDEFIYDYDVEMGYSEEPEEKADASDQDDRKEDGDPAKSEASDQEEAETGETGEPGETGETDGTGESDETGEPDNSDDAGREDQQDATDSDRSDDDKKN